MDNIKNRLGFEEKLHVIPNASDNELFGKYIALTKEQLSVIGDKPYVLHLGSLGFIHNCSYLIEVARYIPEIPMVFVGDGAERKELEELAAKYEIKNVFFLGQMPKKDTVAWMSNCELSLFTTLDNIIQDTSSPNKVFDSFAAGKPVIQTTRGWIYDLIEREHCGFSADPQKPEDFAYKVKEYFKLGVEEKDKITASAIRLSQTQFNRDYLSIDYIKILNESFNSHSTSR
jgi:glycosyltransferase involved in cell wall biosynthesis